MPIAIEFDDAHSVCVLCVTSPIGVNDFVDGYSKILDKPQFRENVDALWNISKLILKKIPVTDVSQLPSRLRQFMKRRGDDYKAAIVTTRVIDFQLLRVYLGLLKLIGNNFELRLFNSRDAAYKWLEVSK